MDDFPYEKITLRKELTNQKKVLDENKFDTFSEICNYVLDKHVFKVKP